MGQCWVRARILSSLSTEVSAHGGVSAGFTWPFDSENDTMHLLISKIGLSLTAFLALGAQAVAEDLPGLWSVYEAQLKGAKYVDLTHTITPAIPVWAGFGPSQFSPALHPESGKPYTYANDGFEAIAYALATDQLGTQLDPPAHSSRSVSPSSAAVPAATRVTLRSARRAGNTVSASARYRMRRCRAATSLSIGMKSWACVDAEPRLLRLPCFLPRLRVRHRIQARREVGSYRSVRR
jgi:hypothetical protein